VAFNVALLLEDEEAEDEDVTPLIKVLLLFLMLLLLISSLRLFSLETRLVDSSSASGSCEDIGGMIEKGIGD
jgi:biopolymer transport protein ExbD